MLEKRKNIYPKNVGIENDKTLENVTKLLNLGAIDNVQKNGKFWNLVINEDWVVIDIEPENQKSMDQELRKLFLSIYKTKIFSHTDGGLHLWAKITNKESLKDFIYQVEENVNLKIEYKKKLVFLKNNYHFQEETNIGNTFINRYEKTFNSGDSWKNLRFIEILEKVNFYIKCAFLTEELGRNNFINKVAFICKINGVEKDLCLEILETKNSEFSTPLNKREIISTLNSAYKGR